MSPEAVARELRRRVVGGVVPGSHGLGQPVRNVEAIGEAVHEQRAFFLSQRTEPVRDPAAGSRAAESARSKVGLGGR
jgi:hypothetical protein